MQLIYKQSFVFVIQTTETTSSHNEEESGGGGTEGDASSENENPKDATQVNLTNSV